MKKLLAGVLLVLCLPHSGRAWNAEGHMVVAQIAYNHLTPEAKARFDALIAVPVFNSGNNNSNFVTAACWADDIKGSTSAYNIWHYIDIPFGDSTVTNNVGPASFDVVLAINQCIATLQNPTATVSNQAVSLRFLLHFVGDIQQPMHCSTAVSTAHPSGDAGGNSFSLLGSWSNLHSLWDAGGGLLTDSVSRPLNSTRQTTLNNRVAEVEAAYPYVAGPSSIPNPMDWAVEGWGLAQTVSYVGITNGTSPTADYLAAAMATTRQRMAQGGKRLADLLNAITLLPGQYAGNGDSGFGGPVGQGSLLLTDDGTNIFGTLAKGPNNLGDVLVLYIDSVPGGFTDTSSFSDGTDGLRRAISGFDGSANRSTLTFTGMNPDYAIALGPASDGFGGLWQLASGGSNRQQFIASVNLSPTGTPSAPTYTFSFNVGQIGLATNSGATIKLLGTYISNTGYRSLEALPGSVTGTQGWAPFAQTATATYTIVARIPIVATQSAITANGEFTFAFTNLPGASFTVLGSTNAASSVDAWSDLGQAVEVPAGSGVFQFTDPETTNNGRRYYRVRSP